MCKDTITFKEHLNEVKVGRGWSGRLKNINELVDWMEVKGLLKKGEIKKRDSIVRQYYRYYNDGDKPYFATRYDWEYDRNRPVKIQIEEELERRIEEFFGKMLSKYLKDIDRGEMRLSDKIIGLKSIVEYSALGRPDLYESDFDKYISSKELHKQFQAAKKLKEDVYKEFWKEFDGVDWEETYNIDRWNAPDPLKVISASINVARSNGIKLSPKLEKIIKKSADADTDLSNKVRDLLIAAEKLRAQQFGK